METIFASILNWRTTVLGVLIFVVGVLPDVGNLFNGLISLLQGDFVAIFTVKNTLGLLIAAFAAFFAKDSTTGSLPK